MYHLKEGGRKEEIKSYSRFSAQVYMYGCGLEVRSCGVNVLTMDGWTDGWMDGYLYKC